MSHPRFKIISHLAEPKGLVNWLNDGKRAEESGSAVLLLNAVREAVAVGRQLYSLAVQQRPDGSLNDRHDALIKEINQRLQAYKAVPQIAPPIGPGAWLFPVWIPAEFERNLSSVTRLSKSSRIRMRLHASMEEIDAILTILVIARDGRLDRLRECKHCHRWFYARVLHQEFHNRQCQQAFYKSSEVWKTHRRQWMQNYRRVKAQGNVK